MKQDIFTEFDQIMSDRIKKLNAFSQKYDVLKSEAERKVKAIFFGKEPMYLGHFCPSLIFDKISNFKRDKLKKTLNKNTKNYTSYEVDEHGALLRMKEVNQYGTVVETYIIKDKDEEFSITFSKGELTSSSDTVRAIYDADHKIIRVDFISNYSLNSEIYSYQDNTNRHIKCTQYYYVPKLKDSDSSKKPGETNSPAKHYEIDILMNDKKEVQRLEYGEIINGKRDITFVYENDN